MTATLAPRRVVPPAASTAGPAGLAAWPLSPSAPNPIVCGALYLFVLSIPFEIPQRSIPLETTTITAGLFLLTTVLELRACYGRIPPALRWFGAWLWVFLVAALVGSGEHALFVLQYLAELAQMMLAFWAASNLMRDRRVLRAALATFVVACALRAGLQVSGIGATARAVWTGGERETVLGQNANLSALIMSAGLLAALGLRQARAWAALRPSVVFWPLAALLGSAVVHTGSRGGLLALTAGLLVFSFRGASLGQRVRNGLAVVFALGFLVWASFRVEMMRNRFAEAARGGLAGRERIYPALLGMVVERPVLGWGPITNQVELARRIHEKVKPRRDAHNLSLEVLTATGFVGLLPFWGGLWMCFLAARRGRAGPDGMILPLALFVELIVGTTSGTWIASKLLWFIFSVGAARDPGGDRAGVR